MGQAFEALGLNLPAIIAQTVNFLILFFLLRAFLFKPILKMLDDRRERIAEGLNAAETARAEAAQAQVKTEELMADARRQSQEAVANAQNIAARIQAEAREQAGKDRELTIERARAEIQQERDRAIAELRGEFASITVKAAERVIGESLDGDAHRRIIDETLAESNFSGN
jgi:F-type H+-transporting ATPase subunit b